MYSIDERLRGLPAVKDQVVQLYQSLNQPHLAIPNRKAGPASATVLGLRGPSGFAVFVYLYMPQSGESAVYVPSNGTVAAELFQGEEAEALGFVESMGFIMDNLNFRGRPPDEQETMIRTLPVFQREPPAPSAVGAPGQPAKPGTGGHASVVQLGKLFSAFCLALLAQGCAHVSEKDQEQSNLHYELALQSLLKEPQQALKEADVALALNPRNAEAWHVKGLVLHHSFGRYEESRAAFARALELKSPFPEANNNLGNLFMDQKRWDDAITQYQLALNDVMFREPYLAQGNMGWAYFKKGDSAAAVENLRAALQVSPKYCMGELQLAQVYESQQNVADACKYYGRYREHCPDRADAWQREGVCLASAGDNAGAGKAFDTCVEKSSSDDQKDLCRSLKEQLLR